MTAELTSTAVIFLLFNYVPSILHVSYFFSPIFILHLLLLSIASSLAESSPSNVLVHPLVKENSDRTIGARNVLNEPQHESMAPPRGVSVGSSLVTTESNLAKSSLDEVASVGDKKTRAADLAHGGCDKVAQYKVHINVVVSKLSGESVAPLLKESLATRVCRQERSRSPATERSHGEDKTALALLQNRSDDLSNSESTNAVDGDNVLKLLLGGLEERNRDAVALTNVVDENTNIKTRNQLAQTLVVGILVLGEVHVKDLDLQALSRVLLLNLGGEALELGEGSGNEDEVEALGSELQSIFLTEAIRGTGDDSPGTRLSILAEL
jgi:hypothetical protein